MQFVNLEGMCDWERRKAYYLAGIAEDLGMSTSEYGYCAVNENSGNVYVWLQDYNFSLYMPISCSLQRGDVMALWSCPETGLEIGRGLFDFDNVDTLSDWAASLEEIAEYCRDNDYTYEYKDTGLIVVTTPAGEEYLPLVDGKYNLDHKIVETCSND